MRILIGFVEIGGYHSALQKGLNKKGYKCDFVPFTKHKFAYRGSNTSVISKIVIGLILLRDRLGRKDIGLIITLLRMALQYLYFLYASIRYDVFIFGFGSTFFTPITPSLERVRFFGAQFLVRIGKKVIFLMQGSDARPPFMDGNYQHFPAIEIAELNKKKKLQIAAIEKTGAQIVCDRALAAYFTKPVIDRSYILCPIDTDRVKVSTTTASRTHTLPGIIRVLHAPSDPELKGSDIIAKVVTGLNIPGKKIEYIELRNRSNREVIDAISDCDIVIDQLYSDIVLPIFPSEAAWLAKPVIIGIYDPKFVLRNLSSTQIPPAWYIHPKNLEKSLKKILVGRSKKLSDRGLKMKNFIAANATEVRIAEKFLKIITGDFPLTWLYDPSQYDYIHGCVMSELAQRRIINNLVASFSISALLMTDKKKYIQKLYAKKFIPANRE